MTAIDTNILIDLLVADAKDHKNTTEGMSQLHDSYCTTQTNMGECLRLLTHPRVFPHPLSATAASLALQELFEHYQIRILEEAEDWWKAIPEMEKIIPGLRGNEIFDARIALCLRSHNVKRIYTRDADFRKYPFLKPIRLLSQQK